MKVTRTALPEVLLIEPDVFADNRGHFYETHNLKKYQENGINHHFVQDNYSFSKKDVLRGLHYQLQHAQDKLVYVAFGKVVDIVADIRHGSPNFGKWITQELSDENHLQLFIPKGFAHGFCVLSETAHFIYKCTDYYYPKSEFGVIWDDPTLNIEWPIENPILSVKDALNKRISDIPTAELPVYMESTTYFQSQPA